MTGIAPGKQLPSLAVPNSTHCCMPSSSSPGPLRFAWCHPGCEHDKFLLGLSLGRRNGTHHLCLVLKVCSATWTTAQSSLVLRLRHTEAKPPNPHSCLWCCTTCRRWTGGTQNRLQPREASTGPTLPKRRPPPRSAHPGLARVTLLTALPSNHKSLHS